MANWRETGCVPDSDTEDDGDISIQNTGELLELWLHREAEGLQPLQATHSSFHHLLDPATVKDSSAIDMPEGGPLSENPRIISLERSTQGRNNNAGDQLQMTVGTGLGELQVLDLSELPDLDEEDTLLQPGNFEGDPNIQCYPTELKLKVALPDPIGQQGNRDGELEPCTPKWAQSPVAVSEVLSPLTELPSHLNTPTASPLRAQSRTTAFSVIIPYSPQPHCAETASRQSIALSSDVDDFTSGPLRNLRQRKPIQLNPYLIEQARYRQTLKARGLKPIIIHSAEDSQSHINANPGEEEYQASGDEEEESQPRRQQAGDEASQTEWMQPNPSLSEDDWEFPDVTTLLRESFHKNGTEMLGVKRRKLKHTYPSKPEIAQQPTRQKLVLEEPQALEPGTSPTYNSQIHSGILPVSSENSSPTYQPRRWPLTQRSVNNPASSVSTLHIISSDGESTPLPRGRQRGRTISISSSSSFSSLHSVASDRSVDLRPFQKQTNGVLPASWWKLDYQKRRTNNGVIGTKRTRKAMSPQTSRQPGIARARISGKPRSETENIFSATSDVDSESDNEETTPYLLINSSIQPGAVQMSRGYLSRWLGMEDEIIVEDDKIDAMLQKTSRKKQITLKLPQKKYPCRKSDQWDLSSGSILDEAANHRYSTNKPRKDRRSKQVLEHRTQRKELGKQRPTRLSVVDVYNYQQATSTSSPPRFLKIAKRTAKNRSDRAQRGPQRKLFVLETGDDTSEVQGILRDWREGTLDVIAYTQQVERERRNQARGKKHDRGDPGSNIYPAPIQSRHTQLSGYRLQPSISKPPYASFQKACKLKAVVGKSQSRPLTKPRRLRQTVLKPVATPAQVQSLSREFDHNTLSFQRAEVPLINLLRQKRPAHSTGFSHPTLARFLHNDDLMLGSLAQLKTRKEPQPPPKAVPLTVGTPPRRIQRKNPPRRIDADTRERRQPPLEHMPVVDGEPILVNAMATHERPSLTGLAPSGTRYSINFDTQHLKTGIIFNMETFIGSAGLSNALFTLSAPERTFGSRTVTFTFAEHRLSWGTYRDCIATEFEVIVEKILDGMDKMLERQSYQDVDGHLLASQAHSFYRFCSNYVAQILHFSDSIDLVVFAQRFLKVLHDCTSRISLTLTGLEKMDLTLPLTKLGIQTLWFTSLLAFQISQLCGDTVRSSLELEAFISNSTRSLISRLLRCGIEIVRECFEEQRVRSHFERGIGGENYIVEAWVIVIYILDRFPSPDITFWKVLNSELHYEELDRVTDVGVFEWCWKTTFSLLPLFQFDAQGVVTGTKPVHLAFENWELLKRLAGAFFGHYKNNGDRATINNYCRILYTRTHHLITAWGWVNPEPMIATLFNFFVSNSLLNLRNESDHGSPLFLQQLDKQPSLVAEASDVCFHLLLKVAAIGLASMRTTAPIKKIRDYVFRLIPNHRRQYPKEEDLRIEHLIALRNHHDLLCTLYWASPPRCRPPLSAIRDLVDPGSSHTRACAVSVRAWSYLIRFQLHAHEDIALIQPLMDWFEDIINQVLTQHNSCRAEITKQFALECGRGGLDISEADLEDTIRRNQKELDGLLLEAVRALGTAMVSVKGMIPCAMKLLTFSGTGGLYNSFSQVSQQLVMEALEVVNLYLKACRQAPACAQQSALMSEQANEESQDYGDWSAMEDLVFEDEKKAAGEHLIRVLYEPLLRMVSSALGADKQPTDIFLAKVIDVWVEVSVFLVQQGLKNWNMYLDDYSRESWALFRDTPQTRKFTAYYMSRLLDTSCNAYSANKSIFLLYWFRALVERKSMLQYQHQFTSALLNMDPGNPILQNLPFAMVNTGVFCITHSEFESRRLSLISMVLANIRIAYDDSPEGSSLRGEYCILLQSLMRSMRENYLHQASPNDVYVPFVQQVVSLLQQHTPDIIPIDKFFTDSSAFPLPSDDPTYVVGKLRNYALKLSQPQTHKQLAAFFQSVCERAAIDGEQDYLVNQLSLAMEGEQEQSRKVVTLRAFLMQGIFPAYVQCAFEWKVAGWMLAIPVVNAASRAIERIRAELNSFESGAILAVIHTLRGWIRGVMRALMEGFIGIDMSERWDGPDPVVAMAVLMIQSVAGCLPVLDWLLEQECRGSEEEEWDMERRWTVDIVVLLIRIIAWLANNKFSSVLPHEFLTPTAMIHDIRKDFNVLFCGTGIPANKFEHVHSMYLNNHQSSLNNEWHCVSPNSEELVFTRNSSRRIVSRKSTSLWVEVFAGVEGGEGCRKLVGRVIREFLEAAARTGIWGWAVRESRRDIWEGEVGRRGKVGRVARVTRAKAQDLFC